MVVPDTWDTQGDKDQFKTFLTEVVDNRVTPKRFTIVTLYYIATMILMKPFHS